MCLRPFQASSQLLHPRPSMHPSSLRRSTVELTQSSPRLGCKPVEKIRRQGFVIVPPMGDSQLSNQRTWRASFGHIQMLRVGVHAGVPNLGEFSANLIAQDDAWNGRPAGRACPCRCTPQHAFAADPHQYPSGTKKPNHRKAFPQRQTPICTSDDYLQNIALAAFITWNSKMITGDEEVKSGKGRVARRLSLDVVRMIMYREGMTSNISS